MSLNKGKMKTASNQWGWGLKSESHTEKEASNKGRKCLSFVVDCHDFFIHGEFSNNNNNQRVSPSSSVQWRQEPGAYIQEHQILHPWVHRWQLHDLNFWWSHVRQWYLREDFQFLHACTFYRSSTVKAVRRNHNHEKLGRRLQLG